MKVYCCCPNNVKVSTVILFTAIQHQKEDESFFFTFTHQIIIRRHTSNKDRQPNGQNKKKRQTMVAKTLHRRLKTEQHNSNKYRRGTLVVNYGGELW
jgi:hypothetical protein